jgi:hypothetical protein
VGGFASDVNVDVDYFRGTIADLQAFAGSKSATPPPTPGTCPLGNGLYCGGNHVGGNPLDLYQCTAGALTLVQACALGCERMPDGQNDRCFAGSVCPDGDGLYCGGHDVGGAPAVLYACNAGHLTKAQACANGCQWMPVGQNDVCK